MERNWELHTKTDVATVYLCPITKYKKIVSNSVTLIVRPNGKTERVIRHKMAVLYPYSKTDACGTKK